MCGWMHNLWLIAIPTAVALLASCGGEDAAAARSDDTAGPSGRLETDRPDRPAVPGILAASLSRVAEPTRSATPDDPPEKKMQAEKKPAEEVQRPRTFWEFMNLSREERKKLQRSMSMQEFMKYMAELQQQASEQSLKTAEARRAAGKKRLEEKRQEQEKRRAEEQRNQEQRRAEEAGRRVVQRQKERDDRAVELMREGTAALFEQDYRTACRTFQKIVDSRSALQDQARYYLAESMLRQSRQDGVARVAGRRGRGRGPGRRGGSSVRNRRQGDRSTGRGRVEPRDRGAARGERSSTGRGVDSRSQGARPALNPDDLPALAEADAGSWYPQGYVQAFKHWLEAYENAPDLWPSFSRAPFALAAWTLVVDGCAKSRDPVGLESPAAWRVLVDDLAAKKHDAVAARASREWFALDRSPGTHFRRLELQQWANQGREKVNQDRNLYRELLDRDDLSPELRSRALVRHACAHWNDRIMCEEKVREALGHDRENGSAWWVLAHIALRNSDRVRAAELLGTCAGFAPRNTHVRSVRAAVLMVIDRDVDAVRSIEEATRINGQATANWFSCSTYLQEKLKDEARSLTALVRAAEAGTDGRCWQLVSLRYRKAGRLREAADAMQRAIRQGADSVENLTLLGECYLELGKQSEAGAAYGRAVARHPQSPVPWNSYRVQSLQALRNDPNGVERAAPLNGLDPRAARRLAERQARSGARSGESSGRAEACLRIAGEIRQLAQSHDSPWAACAEIGLLHACAGRIESAVEWYLKAFDQTDQESLRGNLEDLSRLAPEQLQPLARGILDKRVSLSSLVRVREFVQLRKEEQQARMQSLALQRRYFGQRHHGGGYNRAQAEASRAAARAVRDYRYHIASHYGYLGF